MPVQPCFRLARALVFATVCLTLTTAGHAYTADACVPPGAVAAGFLLVTGLSLLLCGAERSFWTIGGVLAGAQFALHALFTAASAGAVAGTSGVAHHGGEAHAVPAAHGGSGMTLAHLGAALVAAWWLRRGEAAMWSLARRVSAVAGRPWRPIAVSPAVFPAPPGHRPARPAPSMADAPLRHALVRRGPPAR